MSVMDSHSNNLSKKTMSPSIIFLTYYFFPHVGGGTWTSYNICRVLQKKGHDVLLLAPHIVGLDMSRNNVGSQDKGFFSIDRYLLPRVIAPLLAAFRNFCRGFFILRRRRFDVIMVQYHPHHLNFPFGLLLSCIYRLPIVVKADDVYRDMGINENLPRHAFVQILNTLNERLIRFANMFLVGSSENLRSLRLRQPKLSQHLLQLSPNGFALPNSQVVQNYEKCRRNKKVAFIGRFSGKEYGIELLLEAMPLVIANVPNTKLVLAGDCLNKSSRKIIVREKLEPSVIIYPPVSPKTVSRIISEASVCIGPLFPTQTIPSKVLEYMALSKPVISGLNSISSDLAINRNNCLLVAPEPKNIADAIVELLTNSELATQIGQNAYLTVQRFSWENVVEDIINKILTYVLNHE